jgi:(p)ppGpp synthase/HD superfamily hydrolase
MQSMPLLQQQMTITKMAMKLSTRYHYNGMNGLRITTPLSNGSSKKAFEYPENETLCKECLPILGDDIVETRPIDRLDGSAKVHRVDCRHAQHALQDTQAPSCTSHSAYQAFPIAWSDILPSEYLAEVVVTCQDRKLLLADCSEIVSEHSSICKTGSVTTNDQATLRFLIKVNSLQHLQHVMERLGQVRSVISVERRVSEI